jgi:hypothetical protein
VTAPPTRKRTILSVDPDQDSWTVPQQALLRELINHWGECPHEHQLRFLHACQASGLDPFLRQVYIARDRFRQWYVQAHIEGIRLAAQRTAHDAGEMIEYEETVWIGADGTEHRGVFLGSKQHPVAAKSAVVKIAASGLRARTPSLVYWNEYCPKHIDLETGELVEDAFWLEHPMMRLGQVCESAALRAAYPGALSAVLLPAEAAVLSQQSGEAAATEALAAGAAQAAARLSATASTSSDDAPEPPSLADGIRGLLESADEAGFGGRLRAGLKLVYGTDDLSALTDTQLTEIQQQAAAAVGLMGSSQLAATVRPSHDANDSAQVTRPSRTRTTAKRPTKKAAMPDDGQQDGMRDEGSANPPVAKKASRPRTPTARKAAQQ